MPRKGNPNWGLKKVILDVIYENGQEKIYDSNEVAQKVRHKGYTPSKRKQGHSPDTLERAVNMYLSQDTDYFQRIGRNSYRLRNEHHRVTGPSLEDLSTQFDEQALAVYENGKRELHYNGTRFLQKVRADGGVAAAKSWLRFRKKDKPTNGFLKLVDFGKLELSLEALVLKEPWSSLFTEDELAVARRRLEKYGFFEPKGEAQDRDYLLPEEVDNSAYWEGAVKSVVVNRYERDAKARRACIKHYGPKCYICGFGFAAVYGSQFKSFIHVHHLCSLASIGAGYQVDPIADLRPICPNCHAIVHRRKNPCFTIEEVRSMLALAKGP